MSAGESKTGRPFFSKWVWKDWEVKTRHMDPFEYTAYHRLLSFAATCSPDLCSIPNDERRMARAAGLGIKRFRQVAPQVLHMWFLRDDGRYEHPRLREDAELWLEHCAWQQKRRTGGHTDGPPSDPPEHNPTRARARSQKLESRKEEESVSVPSNGLPNVNPVRTRTGNTPDPGPAFWNDPATQDDLARLKRLKCDDETARSMALHNARLDGRLPA